MSNTTLISSFVNQLTTVVNETPLLGTDIIEHVGGVSAFEITSDMISLGIKLKNINGFKDEADTSQLFNRHKYAFMGTIQEIAERDGIEPVVYLFEICHVNRYSYELVTQYYNMLCDEEAEKSADVYTKRELNAVKYQITLAIVTKLLEAYHKAHDRRW